MTEAELRALAERVPVGDPRLREVRHRWVNRTEHWAWIFDEQVLIKKYVLHPGKQNRWKVWEKERRALECLRELATPACLGHFTVREPDGLTAHVLLKEFIPGDDVAALDEPEIGTFAELMANIHARGAVTNDPTCANLIRTTDGQLAFIDFGRAAIYPQRGPVYWWYLGKELSRTYRKALRGSPELMSQYAPRYFETLGQPRGWQRALLAAGFRYWCARKKIAAPPIFP